MSGKVYSAMELAKLGLPVLPGTYRNILLRAEAEQWPFMVMQGRGGDSGEIKLYSVPEYVQAAIGQRRAQEAAALIVGTTSPQNAEAADDAATLPTTSADLAPPLGARQRKVANARASILVHVLHRAASLGQERAVQETLAAAAAGTLPEHLQDMVSVASYSGKLTRATVYRWLSYFDVGRPDSVERLAPRSSGATKRANWQRRSTAWMEPALKLYQRPQKPSLRWVHENLAEHLPAGVAMPSYDSLRRYMSQMGNVEVLAGRMGPRELKAHKPFIRRATDTLWPADIYMADGHTFDAEIAHPAHGRPFRPEITSVIDVATRRIVGWSIDLAESGLAVLDALRHAVETGGIPSIFYVDRGSGYRNAMISGAGTGLLARLGTRLEHSLPYNSQARGIIERLHQSVWVRAARELPTYIGADMDPQASNKVHKLTRREVKTWGRSRVLMAWPDFLRFAAERVAAYNDRPHRSLPRLLANGRRHMTPNEAWARGVEEGAALVELMPGEAEYLFRPQKEVRALRGEVRLFNNLYFSHELTEYHGDAVRVGYDIHDASRVWVYDQDGRFICTAEFEANKRAFMPESVLELAARQRAEGRARRLQDQLTEVREELHGGPLVLENAPSPSLPTLSIVPAIEQPAEPVIDRLATSALTREAPAVRPAFGLPSERYEWLKSQRPDTWSEADRAWLREYVADPDGYALFAERFELLGLAWGEADEAAVFNGPLRAVAGS